MHRLKRSIAYLILGQKGGENRIQILELLKDRPYNLNQMADTLKLNYRTVKHHIEILLKHDLLTTSKSGGYGEVYFLSLELEQNFNLLEDAKAKLKNITSSPRMFQNVMEQTNDGVILLSADREVIFWNNSAEKIFGHEQKDAIGENIQIFRNAEQLDEMIRGLSDGKPVCGIETLGLHKSRGPIEIEATVDVIFDEDGKECGYSILCRDITYRKEFEKLLTLKERIDAMGNLAGGLGRELYNPLGSINNAVYFLRMAIKDPEPDVERTLDLMEKETEFSVSMVRNLLEFSRRKQPNASEADLNVLLTQSLNLLPGKESLNIKEDLDRNIPSIRADADQMAVVLNNILLAATNTEKNGGTLILATRANHGNVSVSISNSELSLAKKVVDRMFDPSHTFENGRMSLPMAKWIVEKHGGIITVESKAEKGTVFTLLFPNEGGGA